MECSLCFTKKKKGNSLQNFRCPNLSGKFPMCLGIEIRYAEITYHRTSTDVVLNAVVSHKKKLKKSYTIILSNPLLSNNGIYQRIFSISS